MAIDVGDAVLTFLGDASQLDLAFDNVNASAETKLKPAAQNAKEVGKALDDAGKTGQRAGQEISESWLRVARATQENKTAQKEVADAMKAVQKAGSDNSSQMGQLAAAQERAAASAIALAEATKAATEAGAREASGMRERRESAAAFGELTGVKIPRGLRTWMAEMPLLGSAMEAAFSVLAPLLLISVLSDGIQKLIDWHEEAEKLREEWTRSDTEFRTTSTHIKEQIDQQTEKFIELTQGPIAAYEFALKHLKSTFDDSVGQIGSELDKQGQKFVDRGSWIKAIFGGEDSANAKSAGKDLIEFSAILQETMKSAHDANKDNPFSGFDAGLDKLKEKLGEVGNQIEDEKKKIAELNAQNGTGGGIGNDVASLERLRTNLQQVAVILQQARDKEKVNRETEQKQIASNELAKQSEFERAKLDVQNKFAQLAVQITAEREAIAFARGKESLAQYLSELKTNEDNRYQIEAQGLQDRLTLAMKDPIRNQTQIIAINGQIREVYQQHQLNLLKIEQEGYIKQADQITKGLERIVASTKEGSQERIDAEQAVADFLKKTFGEQSDAYLAAQTRVTASQTAQMNVRKLLIREEAHFEQEALTQKESANLAYYSALKNASQISAKDLLSIQQISAEQIYQGKKSALIKEYAELAPQEVVARKKVNDSMELLEREHENQRRLNIQQTNDIINVEYQALGIKSTMMLMNERDRAKEAYGDIARSGTASYGQILQAQIKVLQATIELNAAEGKDVSKDEAGVKKLTDAYNRLQFALGHVNTQAKLGETILKGLGVQANQMGGTIQNVALGSVAALSKMFQAWSQGGVTVAQACEQMTAAILQSIAQYAFAKAIEQLALGWADLGDPLTASYAPAHFTSAALWFAAGAAGSIAGGFIAGAASGSGGAGASSNTSSSSLTSSGSQQAAQTPINAINIQSFAGGGLITSPTLAMLGDKKGGGSAIEAALPLEDNQAMDMVGGAIAAHMSGGDTHIHVRGMVSPDNLTKVMRLINRKVTRGQGNLVASNSLRITKRS